MLQLAAKAMLAVPAAEVQVGVRCGFVSRHFAAKSWDSGVGGCADFCLQRAQPSKRASKRAAHSSQTSARLNLSTSSGIWLCWPLPPCLTPHSIHHVLFPMVGQNGSNSCWDSTLKPCSRKCPPHLWHWQCVLHLFPAMGRTNGGLPDICKRVQLTCHRI